MVLEKFFISLDNDVVVYFPGQEITGHVHVWNKKPKNVIGNVSTTLKTKKTISFTYVTLPNG